PDVQGSMFDVRGSMFLRLLREKLPFFALSLASSVVTFLVQKRSGAVTALESLRPDQRLVNVICAYGSYLRKTCWPVDLAPFYAIPLERSDDAVILPLACLFVVSAAVFMSAKRFPYLPVGWFWFLGTLVPAIGLVQVGA